MALLKVEGLKTSFSTKRGWIHPVDEVSYSIEKGQTLGVVGESGCGKTVMSFSVMGLIDSPGKISSGKILFHNTDLTKQSRDNMRKMRGKKIAMIFQEPMTALNPVLTIGFQIIEQIRTHEDITKAEALNRAVELLKKVGIPAPEKRVHNYPHQLSGGMRQRAMIAMALSCNPELLIADEPTTALDVTIQAQILDLLQELKEDYNMAIQFITHDLAVVSEIADNVMVMYAGRVVEYGPAEDVFNSPKHPYTLGLLNSIPSLDVKDTRLTPIEGSVPALDDLPNGCRFQNRCPSVTKSCTEAEPALEVVEDKHKVACFEVAR